MYNFKKLNEADFETLMNDFRNMLNEVSEYVPQSEFNEIIDNSMNMESDFYREYGLNDIADAVKVARAEKIN